MCSDIITPYDSHTYVSMTEGVSWKEKEPLEISWYKTAGDGAVHAAACHRFRLFTVYICDIEKGRKPVPDGILEPFPQILHLTKSETDEMYDLTAKSRNTLSFGAFVNLSINCQKLLSSDSEKKGEKRKKRSSQPEKPGGNPA